MNPGVGEEAGQTARTAIEAMGRGAPLMLGILLFNLLWLAVIAYVVHSNGQRWSAVMDTVLKMCSPHGQ